MAGPSPQKDYGSASCSKCAAAFKRNNANHKFCTDCRLVAKREATRAWERRNIDRERPLRAVRSKRWQDANQEKYIATRDAATKNWRKKNRERVNASRRAAQNRRRANIRVRIDHNLSVAVRDALSGRKSGRRWKSLVGYSTDDLMLHLERQFSDGMTWHNYGLWHIDHILPLAFFSYSSFDDPQFKSAWALTNLRPLWRTENLQKNKFRTLLI